MRVAIVFLDPVLAPMLTIPIKVEVPQESSDSSDEVVKSEDSDCNVHAFSLLNPSEPLRSTSLIRVYYAPIPVTFRSLNPPALAKAFQLFSEGVNCSTLEHEAFTKPPKELSLPSVFRPIGNLDQYIRTYYNIRQIRNAKCVPSKDGDNYSQDGLNLYQHILKKIDDNELCSIEHGVILIDFRMQGKYDSDVFYTYESPTIPEIELVPNRELDAVTYTNMFSDSEPPELDLSNNNHDIDRNLGC